MVHRDIKLENILVHSMKRNHTDLKIKITDFGLATFLKDGQELSGVSGSLNYMAPEVINSQNYSVKIDIWSATVAIFVLLSGEMPFYGSNEIEVR